MRMFPGKLAFWATAAFLAMPWVAFGQTDQSKYGSMGPVEQYLMPHDAEIVLAKSAAPESISADAEVLVLGPKGYETAVKGSNGFTCVVQRSFTAGLDEPEFWNPKVRAPICYNAAASRSYLLRVVRKTEMILSGVPKEEAFAKLGAAVEKKELPPLEPGAMCYMLSSQGYLNDRGGHWHPHVMFFVPETETKTWGADFPGSPILAATDKTERITVFLVPVTRWSDGTAAPPM